MGSLVRSTYALVVAGFCLCPLASAAGSPPPPIVFSSSRAPGLQQQLGYSIRLDGTGRRAVADQGAVVSPDGRLVARTGSDDVHAFVEVAEAGSSAWSTVAQFPRTDPNVDESVAQIVWSPRSDRLAITVLLGCKFRGAPNCNVYDLWSVYANGNQLAHVLLHASRPAWAPDDRRLAFQGYVPHFGAPGVSVGYADGTGIRRLARGTAPAWSPDGRTIALLQSWRLALVSSNGAHLRRLVPDVQPPQWSPRTQLIAVVSPGTAGRGNELGVLDPRTARYRRLVRVSKAFTLRFGAWSPSGRTIAYVATTDTFVEGTNVYAAGEQIFTIPALGGPPSRVTHEPPWTELLDVGFADGGRRIAYDAFRYDSDANLYAVADGGTAPTQLTTGPADELDPSWSPDGRIVFERSNERHRLPLVVPGLFVLDPGTGAEQRLTSGSWDTQPAWSPDGSTIVFVRHGVAGSELYTIAPDGSGLHQLTHDGCNDSSPSWSPQSTRLVFTSCVPGGTQLVVTDRDGGNRRALTDLPYAAHPDWSPDGRRIAFAAQSSPDRGLFTIAPDGTSLQRISTAAGGFPDQPAWSADGTHLLYTTTTTTGTGNLIREVALDGTDDHVVTGSLGSNDSPHWRRPA